MLGVGGATQNVSELCNEVRDVTGRAICVCEELLLQNVRWNIYVRRDTCFKPLEVCSKPENNGKGARVYLAFSIAYLELIWKRFYVW